MTTRTLLLWDIDGTLVVSGGAGQVALEASLRDTFALHGSLADIEFAGRTDRWIVRRIFEKFDVAYQLAAQHDGSVIAEQFIAGREVTAAILNDQALPLVRIEAPQGNYDYHNKYFGEATKYHCPSGLTTDLEAHIQQQALAAFRIVGCHGWGRLDLMLDAENRPWFLEVNTIPGMTDHSLVPMAARASGIGFDDLVLRILEAAHVGHVE